MAAKSKNKYDVFNWIKDEVIPSIDRYEQITTTKKLISNFFKLYYDHNDYHLEVTLKHELQYQEERIVQKILNKSEFI